MQRDSGQNAATRLRGDTVKAIRLTGHRVALSASQPAGGPALGSIPRSNGFTLIELVMTVTIMAILALGAIPMVKLSVRRQKEQQLHETLRSIRAAIDEFHRDTVGMPNAPPVLGPPPTIDPRSRVVISDATIFGVDNLDRYPPDLDVLVKGVNVIPRNPVVTGGMGPPPSSQLSTKTKVYLRALPIDPMTGKAEWDLRSCYDGPDVSSWGGENVFDVRSKSKATAL